MPEKQKNNLNAYAKYSGMGIQMALVITVFAVLGVNLDKWLDTKPVFVVILSLTGVAISLYLFIKQVTADDKFDK